jgi:F-type H+-transporting ATPase subunit alpha
VKEFEKDFLNVLSTQYSDALAGLRAGKLDSSVTDVVERVAREVAAKY